MTDDIRNDRFDVQIFETRTDVRQGIFRSEFFRGEGKSKDRRLPLDPERNLKSAVVLFTSAAVLTAVHAGIFLA